MSDEWARWDAKHNPPTIVQKAKSWLTSIFDTPTVAYRQPPAPHTELDPPPPPQHGGGIVHGWAVYDILYGRIVGRVHPTRQCAEAFALALLGGEKDARMVIVKVEDDL